MAQDCCLFRALGCILVWFDLQVAVVVGGKGEGGSKETVLCTCGRMSVQGGQPRVEGGCVLINASST